MPDTRHRPDRAGPAPGTDFGFKWRNPRGSFGYAPDVEVYVDTPSGVYDISPDVEAFTVIRNVNAPSTLSLTINNKCLAGETPVMTRSGVFPIGDLAGKEVELLTAGGRWVKAPVKSYGEAPLMRVTLYRYGREKKVVYATPDHRWYVMCGRGRRSVKEVRTRDLQPWKNGQNRHLLVSVSPERVPARLVAEHVAAGFVFGDGSVIQRGERAYGRANFCGEKDQAMIPWFESVGNPPRGPDGRGVITKSGVPASWKLAMPSVEDDPDLIFSWLAGYFAADGHVTKDGTASLSSHRRGNLEHVRLLCDRLGVFTGCVKDGVNKAGFNEGKPSPIHTLTLSANDLGKEFFLIPAHRARWRAGRHEKRRWSVWSVEETDRLEEVFCAEVPGTESFALEDHILTGNSRKWDRVIPRMSRIVAFCKRVSWLQVFAGYVDTAPYLTVIPRSVPLTATCTLKRLAHWYWDPYSAEAFQMFPIYQGAAFHTPDGGAAAAAWRLLVDVAEWPPDQIWIQKIPERFIQQAVKVEKVAKGVDPNPNVNEGVKAILGADGYNWYNPGPSQRNSSSRTRTPTDPSGSGGSVRKKVITWTVEKNGHLVRKHKTVTEGPFIDPRARTAVLAARRELGLPYVFAAEQPGVAFDCSGLTKWVYSQAGVQLPHNAAMQYEWCRANGAIVKDPIPGDLVFYTGSDPQGSAQIGHVEIYQGWGWEIGADHTGTNVRFERVWNPVVAYGRVVQPQNDAVKAPPLPAGLHGGNAPGAAVAGTAGGGGNFAMNTPFTFYPTYRVESAVFTGARAWINDVPILQSVQELCKGSLRDLQSAPNGDFVAWFPDKLGVYGKGPAVSIRDIELMDLELAISDDQLVTHVAVAGNLFQADPQSGLDPDWLITHGIVTIQQKEVMELLLNLDVNKDWKNWGGDWMLRRFGLRPLRQEADMLRDQRWVFMYALHLFMQKWSEQFLVTATFTFMPEVFPGMRLELADHGLSFYVEQVTHQGDRTSGFTTQAVLSTPMHKGTDGQWYLLPLEEAPEVVAGADAPVVVGHPLLLK